MGSPFPVLALYFQIPWVKGISSLLGKFQAGLLRYEGNSKLSVRNPGLSTGVLVFNSSLFEAGK
jgi:hypothetical protein